MTDGEIWKDIKDWPFHQVSNKGRIRVLPGGRINNRSVTEIEFKKISLQSSGYLTTRQGKHTMYVHRVVLNAFYGPCPPGQECRHLNGDKSDNRWPENIKWDFPKDNYLDKVRHGTAGHGEFHSRVKLTKSQVDDIRSREWYYGIGSDLAKEFGVYKTAISKIRRGLTWNDYKRMQDEWYRAHSVVTLDNPHRKNTMCDEPLIMILEDQLEQQTHLHPDYEKMQDEWYGIHKIVTPDNPNLYYVD